MSIADFNVLDFGADPTGTTDSWQAFKDWSQAITAAGGGVGLVPAGTYWINKFTNIYEPGSPDDFKFEGCDGLWLVGYGVTLELCPKESDHSNCEVEVHLVNGAIDKHMVCPFYIQDCHNVCIEGFEVNGNADHVQFNGIIETGGHCVTVENSTHVTIRHMRLHHGWTDGICVDAAHSNHLERLACRNIVIENCEIHSHIRAGIAIFETRHVRISNCRIYNNGMGIDIEPNVRTGTQIDKDIEPPGTGSSRDRDPFDENGKILAPPGSSRFTIIENCEIYNNEKPLSVNKRYSHVRVQGCFIDNQRDNSQPVVLSVPHCALLDCEIDTGTGHIDVAITGSLPGYNVFTMERCLVRSHTAIIAGELRTGRGLKIAPEPTVRPLRIIQAIVANNRFINESDQPWFPLGEDGKHVDNGRRFPDLSHGDSMLQLTFRDNYVFIPKEAFSDRGDAPMPAVSMHAQLAENNVYETDKHTPVTYRVTAEDGSSQAYTVTVIVAANPATAITAFSFASPAASGVIDEATHTIAVTVPLGTDVSKLVPTIASLGLVSPASGVETDFTSPVTYKVTAGPLTQIYRVTVNLAKAITAFSFASPAASGVIDEATHRIAVTVPFGTDVSKLVPTITHTGFSVSPNSGVAQNFTVDENYFEVLYGTSGKLPKYGVLVRNERFISAGDGKGIRPAEDTLHDNTLPYNHGV
jgi:hypothetical protein